jgi:ABC-type antimicrobial peptide transport system permease subunit
MYVPFAQAPETQVSVVIRAASDPLALVPALRRAVWEVDPALPVEQWTMNELMSAQTERPRFNAVLLSLFSALAVALAVIGVYGVVSFGVAERQREMGLRMALGARRRDLLTLVLRRGALLAMVGVAIGLVGTVAVTRLMGRLLYGITPTDPATLGAAGLAVIVVVLAGCLLPARRAALVDPVESLRQGG